MKIVLIAPPIIDRVENHLIPIAMDKTRSCPPYGVYLLANILIESGYEVLLIDLIAEGTHNIKKYINDIKDASLIGIGATSFSWPTAVDIVRQIRKVRKDIPIVLGGIHPTMFDKYILDRFPIQFVIRGEGEYALLSLCQAIEMGKSLGDVPNLTWRNPEGKIIRNELSPLIPGEKLANFPLPYYDLLPDNIYQCLPIESSRGCAFDCYFCSTSYRKSWRPIKPDIFVDRLEFVLNYINKAYLKAIQIIDDEFSLNPKRVIRITEIIRQRGLHPTLIYDSRAFDLLHDGFIENIAEFTREFLIGAECGYDEGLNIIGKGITCNTLENVAKLLYKHGISNKAHFSFIIGLPWEGKNEIIKTIQFAMKLFGNYGVRLMLQWYYQIPGSRIWNEFREKEIVNEAMYDNYGFFRNLYLFKTCSKLTPSEFYEVHKILNNIKLLGMLYNGENNMIRFAIPTSILENFPLETLSYDGTGINSLREVSKPETQHF